MAISKILAIRSRGKGNPSESLKRAIDYVVNPKKTEEGVLVGGINCFPETAYSRMVETKEEFEKTGKRQGYHLIVSFNPSETDADTAFKVIEQFTKEYVGDRYEAVFAVHDNTKTIHGHIIFNSVSFVDGIKYQYEKGDWAKEIQPLLNRICAEHGLKELDIDTSINYKRKRDIVTENGSLGVWKDLIIRDIDAAVIVSHSFDGFLDEMESRGYEFKGTHRTEDDHLKYLAFRAPGMKKFRRIKSLGPGYSEEEIRNRIKNENLGAYANKPERMQNLGGFFVVPHRNLTRLQKRFVAQWFRLGLIKKRSYSQAYKYREDIKRLKSLQDQCLFLLQNDMKCIQEVQKKSEELEEKRRENSTEIRRLYRQKALFEKSDFVDQNEELLKHTEEKLAYLKQQKAQLRRELEAAKNIIADYEVANRLVVDRSQDREIIKQKQR